MSLKGGAKVNSNNTMQGAVFLGFVSCGGSSIWPRPSVQKAILPHLASSGHLSRVLPGLGVEGVHRLHDGELPLPAQGVSPLPQGKVELIIGLARSLVYQLYKD